MGRKQAEIDWAKVDSMLRVMETGTAIACALGIHEETLYRAVKREKKMDFQKYAQSMKAQTLFSLKAMQFKVAYGYNTTLTDEKALIDPKTRERKVTEMRTKTVEHEPSVTMLIHLGKHYLGQTEDKDKDTIPGWDIVGDEEEELTE
ncbi:hypothetical protein [Tellurirhabdus bombi]|uniref:hypothetical protein n=1 Tax=Tellurirhabdus bombi TaxID=2907205 RepID=UPI001F3ABD1E|nr:hypothetical protein [Tellurirhabdus bombi]